MIVWKRGMVGVTLKNIESFFLDLTKTTSAHQFPSSFLFLESEKEKVGGAGVDQVILE